MTKAARRSGSHFFCCGLPDDHIVPSGSVCCTPEVPPFRSSPSLCFSFSLCRRMGRFRTFSECPSPDPDPARRSHAMRLSTTPFLLLASSLSHPSDHNLLLLRYFTVFATVRGFQPAKHHRIHLSICPFSSLGFFAIDYNRELNCSFMVVLFLSCVET